MINAQKIYAGEIVKLPPTPESLKLVELVRTILSKTYQSKDLLKIEFAISQKEHYQKGLLAKHNLSHNHKIHQALSKLLQKYTSRVDLLWFDVPRLRIISTTAHQIPSAAPAYAIHRDTWYANSESQFNWWMPIFDTQAQNTFGIYTDYFETAVINDSILFDYAEWKNAGGFQSEKAMNKHFPELKQTIDKTREFKPILKAGEILVFSASHLHGTLANYTDETRISIDFRTVNILDWQSQIGAINVDNASKGNCIKDFLHAIDYSHFPYEA
ncbi:MAG: hypothetical protein AAF518_08865 [Spirochaetota bacterium]